MPSDESDSAPILPASGEPSALSGTLDETPFEIDAAALLDLYNSGNEIAANDQVRGRLLLVGGVVNRIEDDHHSPTVSLVGPDTSYPSTTRVVCRLDSSQRALARVLQPGQAITVVGKGEGLGVLSGQPELSDCRISRREHEQLRDYVQEQLEAVHELLDEHARRLDEIERSQIQGALLRQGPL